MNARSILIALSGGALALLLIKSLQSQPERSAPAHAPDPSPVVSLVEDTLHQHAGKHSPFVAAFDEALHSTVPHGAKPA